MISSGQQNLTESLLFSLSQLVQQVKNLPTMQETQETWVRSLGQEDPPEKKVANHSSILAKKHPMDRGASWATVHGVTKSDMTEQLSTAQHKSQTANVQWAVSQSNEGNALRKDFPFHTRTLHSWCGAQLRPLPRICFPPPHWWQFRRPMLMGSHGDAVIKSQRIWRMRVSLEYFVCVYLPCKGDATSTLWSHKAEWEDLQESSLISVTFNLPVLSHLPCDAPDSFRSEQSKQLSIPYAEKKWEMTSFFLLLVFHIDKWSGYHWTRNLQVHS